MSAKLIKRYEQRDLAACAPFNLPGVQPGGAAFLKTAQQRGPTTVTREDEAGSPPPFRPRQLAGHSAAGLGADPAPERRTAAQRPDPATEFEANAVVAEARAQAERIVADAEGRVAEIERQARERGLSEAEAIITIETAQALEPLRAQLASTINEISNLRAAVAAHAERDLVRLALEIAKKIVHREATIDHEIALTLARVALSRLHNRAVAAVHLHPDDYAHVVMHREKLSSNASVELVEDRSIARGGCLVSTEMGDIDARIEQQFAEIERHLLP